MSPQGLWGPIMSRVGQGPQPGLGDPAAGAQASSACPTPRLTPPAALQGSQPQLGWRDGRRRDGGWRGGGWRSVSIFFFSAGWQRGARNLRSDHTPCERHCLARICALPWPGEVQPRERNGAGRMRDSNGVSYSCPPKRRHQNSPVQPPHCSTAGSSRSPREPWPTWPPRPPRSTRSPLPQRKVQHGLRTCPCQSIHTREHARHEGLPTNLPVFASRGFTPSVPSRPASSR